MVSHSMSAVITGSRPLLSRSGCILKLDDKYYDLVVETVLVPFYRGAVVFKRDRRNLSRIPRVLVPFYRGAVVFGY